MRERIPYAMVGGVKFFARAEVKDVLAYLRVLVNPADSLSVKRIINVPARGIGATTVQRLADLEEEAGGLLAACRLALEREVLRSAAAEKVKAFVDLIESFRQRLERLPYPQLTAQLIEETGYGPALREDGSAEARDRLQNLEELLKGMEEHAGSERTLQDYLERVALVTDLDSYDGAAERVTLMTLHSAKGLEFPVVFMIGMEEGLFPHARVRGERHRGGTAALLRRHDPRHEEALSDAQRAAARVRRFPVEPAQPLRRRDPPASPAPRRTAAATRAAARWPARRRSRAGSPHTTAGTPWRRTRGTASASSTTRTTGCASAAGFDTAPSGSEPSSAWKEPGSSRR